MTALEQYQNIQALVQKDATDIATQIATKIYDTKGTRFGVPDVPYHVHNGIDFPIIPALSVSNFAPLGDVVRVAILEGQTVNNINDFNISGATSVPTLVMPVIYGHGVGTASQFQGGDAEEGETVLFVTPALVFQFWAYLDGDWHGVDLISSGSTATVPTGAIFPFGGSSAPTGYVLGDGSAISRTTFSALFTVFGTTYGAGNGTTTFNVPDLRARVTAGFKSGDTNFGTLGAAVGEAAHTLTIGEMPAHNHPGTYASTVWNTNGANGNNENSAGSIAASVTPGIVPQGGGAAHNNIQPSLTINYIIKT